jgi:hypothetical protein
MEVFIPWSEDPATNRKNIEDAINGGATKLIGERGKVYMVKATKPPARASLRELSSVLRSVDTRTESEYPL